MSLVWPQPADAGVIDWTIVHNGGQPQAAPASDLARRLRLVGTFFEFQETSNRKRTAIIEDRQTGVERLVSEGDEIAEARVVSIFRDRVILRDAGGDTELLLSATHAGAGADGHGTGPEGSQTGPTGAGSTPDRFGGRRIAEGRWVYDRTELLKYYQELRDEPERLVGVFDSLVPLRDDVNDITGYQLSVQSEADFFASVGMREGDVVRRVNSMAMTNRRRAEFLISQFVNNKANAFVIEIERNGEKRKLVYEIRD